MAPPDPELDRLTTRERSEVALAWRRRSENESRTGRVFAQLHARLVSTGAPAEALSLAFAAVSEEENHGQLCAAVARRYDPSVPDPRRLEAPPEPSFPRQPREVQTALFAVLQSSLNETLATGYLGACLEQAACRVSREALRALLSDEVKHARIGWTVLASPELGVAARSAIARAMPVLLDACVGAWLSDVESEYFAALPGGHGSLPPTELRSSVEDTLNAVILPGLEHVGIDPAPAQNWLRSF